MFDENWVNVYVHCNISELVRYVSVLTQERVEVHYKYQTEDEPVSPNVRGIENGQSVRVSRMLLAWYLLLSTTMGVNC